MGIEINGRRVGPTRASDFLSLNGAPVVCDADKRRSVELALAEWPNLSDREIARICAVSNNFVGEQRPKQVSSDDTSKRRTGADGKQYKLPTKSKKDKQQEVADNRTP